MRQTLIRATLNILGVQHPDSVNGSKFRILDLADLEALLMASRSYYGLKCIPSTLVIQADTRMIEKT